VCVLSALGCVYIMLGLPRSAWERFAVWLIIGLVLYFTYGYTHSRLHSDARLKGSRYTTP
jgi:APA family basic amino acid/polyamine antiporter